MYKYVPFVRPKIADAELCDVKPIKQEVSFGTLSGEEAQAFYTEVIGLDGEVQSSPLPARSNPSEKSHVSLYDSSDDEEGPRLTFKLGSSRQRRYLAKDLLTAAQNGNCKDLRKILASKKLNVNLQDAFGWTPLHCAAYEGHVSCVSVLLKYGAAKDLKDNKGRTALDLSRRRKKYRVYHLIQHYGTEQQQVLPKAPPEPVMITCTGCGVEYDRNEEEGHISSIIHRASQGASTDPAYGIPSSNMGFRLLETMGWQKEQGLGSDGQGRKYPVKTQLKRDREGLGLSKKPAKITHFDPKDPRSIRSIFEKESFKKTTKQKVFKEKALEMEFRRAFH